MHRVHELESRDITALVQAATGDANEAVAVQAGALLSSICEQSGSAQAIAARAEAIPSLLTDADRQAAEWVFRWSNHQKQKGPQ
jgi:hypothetical protein